MTVSGIAAEVGTELGRQIDTLVGLGYPELAGMSELEFRRAAQALRAPLEALEIAEPRARAEGAAFVLVVNRSLVSVSERVARLSIGERPGTLSRHMADVDSFRAVVEVPKGPVYAVLGVERGEEFLDARPSEAAPVILGRGRSMLTIEEGISFLHACPEALEKNRCFHTGASRHSDRRVPALWIAERAPHLGWCWENNHHTWLGIASCAARVGPDGETSVTS